MKLNIILLYVVFGTFSISHEIFLKSIMVGGLRYDVYKASTYSHDDNWNAEYFAVHKAGMRNVLCSAFLSAKRNDSTFIDGSYEVYGDRVEFMARFYYRRNNISLDSLKTIFCPDKSGNLFLFKSIEYKDGKEKLVRK